MIQKQPLFSIPNPLINLILHLLCAQTPVGAWEQLGPLTGNTHCFNFNSLILTFQAGIFVICLIPWVKTGGFHFQRNHPFLFFLFPRKLSLGSQVDANV